MKDKQHQYCKVLDGDYLLRMFWDDGLIEVEVTSVDFEIYEIVMLADNSGFEYHVKGADSSSEFTPNIEEAQIMINGFIKWDGCMQFYLRDEPLHVDEDIQLDQLLATLKSAREEAKEIMAEKWLK